MIRRWLSRLIGAWYRLRESLQANPVSPLWLKQQAQEDSKKGVDGYINWDAMRAVVREKK